VRIDCVISFAYGQNLKKNKMRILALTHSVTRSGGAEVALFELVEKLLEQNHEIVLMYSDPGCLCLTCSARI
jgi:hypothetical protein